MDNDCKKKEQQETKEDEDEESDNSEKDLIFWDCPVYGSKKKCFEEKFISEKPLLKALKGLFKENEFWDLAFQATT